MEYVNWHSAVGETLDSRTAYFRPSFAGTGTTPLKLQLPGIPALQVSGSEVAASWSLQKQKQATNDVSFPPFIPHVRISSSATTGYSGLTHVGSPGATKLVPRIVEAAGLSPLPRERIAIHSPGRSAGRHPLKMPIAMRMYEDCV